jgi:hypothetical protein
VSSCWFAGVIRLAPLDDDAAGTAPPPGAFGALFLGAFSEVGELLSFDVVLMGGRDPRCALLREFLRLLGVDVSSEWSEADGAG